MNIEQAKAIAMTSILQILNIPPVFENEKRAKYFSPFRDEKKASFHIDKRKNVWHDFGEGEGGDTLNFVCYLLKSKGEDCNPTDGLRWLGSMTFDPSAYHVPSDTTEEPSKWIITRSGPLEDLALIRYLESRGISVPLTEQYLEEIYLKHAEKINNRVYAIGFKNEAGGYELRNKFLKSSVKPKAPTFIRGKKEDRKGVHLFEGFMDFLTLVTINHAPLKGDAIILNSVSGLKKALPYIKNYDYGVAYSWFDNDAAGDKATATFAKFIKNETAIKHQPMNKMYVPHEDLNAWHMHERNLTL